MRKNRCLKLDEFFPFEKVTYAFDDLGAYPNSGNGFFRSPKVNMTIFDFGFWVIETVDERM